VPNDDSASRSDSRRFGIGGIIAGVFLVLAGWFWFGPNLSPIPSRDPVLVDRSLLRIGPTRQRQSDPPTIFVGGFDRHCMECHRFFPAARETARQLVQHTHIVMDHGLNDRCANCHDRLDANRLTTRSGETVSFSESDEMCAKCHGPTYRDWQRGMHGKAIGYWDAARGEGQRFMCVDCHDPHAPAFPPLQPLPGPNTLRMDLRAPRGEPHGRPVERVDPLRKWQHDSSKAHSPAALPALPVTIPDEPDAKGDQ
jgi:hypothetical protein